MNETTQTLINILSVIQHTPDALPVQMRDSIGQEFVDKMHKELSTGNKCLSECVIDLSHHLAKRIPPPVPATK